MQWQMFLIHGLTISMMDVKYSFKKVSIDVSLNFVVVKNK
jgi:hypothetical protein